MPTKVLLDTDIGSDIDDAICLAYLLAQPECELLGITTVSGEPESRAMIASAQRAVAGRTLPIYPGASQPLLVEQRQPRVPQADALERWPHEQQFPRGQAIEFLRTTIRAHPGEVTLLAIGPMTNLALLFRADPEIPELLRSLVLMCGDFGEQATRAEWNAYCDPHAAAIVYGARPPVHRSLGLNVTTQVVMPAAEVRQRFQTRLLRPVLDFAEVWFQKRDSITFHDPLAAATIFDGVICDFEPGAVEVELEDGHLRGATHWRIDHPDQPHEVGMRVDAGRYFEHFFGTMQAAEA
jgi:inosine-uridine nucleoside N-ribohydrolase